MPNLALRNFRSWKLAKKGDFGNFLDQFWDFILTRVTIRNWVTYCGLYLFKILISKTTQKMYHRSNMKCIQLKYADRWYIQLWIQNFSTGYSNPVHYIQNLFDILRGLSIISLFLISFTHISHNGLKTGIIRTPIFWLAISVKTLSDSISPCYLQLKHIKWQIFINFIFLSQFHNFISIWSVQVQFKLQG